MKLSSLTRISLLLALIVVLAGCSQREPIQEPATPPAAAVVTAAASDPPPSTAVAASPAAETETAAPVAEPMADGLINLAHLNMLSEEAQIDGQPVLITHIYSEAPRYTWVDASGEGIAALDDVARAVIVYLDFYAKTGNTRALERARAGLNFTLRLQADDGEFYNFVLDRGGTINQTGGTSYKSLGWWAYRGLWALARGYAIFKDADPEYAAQLQAAYLKTEQALAARVDTTGQKITVHGFEVPGSIPDGAADATGVAVMALAEYQAIAPNATTEQLLTTLADGLRDYQLGGPGEYPWGMHPHTLAAPGFWHAWGSHQSQALARAGEVLKRDDYVDSAKREIDGFFAWQLATERVQEFGALPFRQGQQAYGTNSIVQAAMNVYRATGDTRYARIGGLHASWFMGNNMARTPMYDPTTGRGYDGIDRELAVNQNAGAESTIEALMALQSVLAVPEAAKYLDYKPTEQQSWRVLEAEDGREIAGKPIYGRRGWTGEARISGDRFYELTGEDAVELDFEIDQPGDYLLFASHMRRAGSAAALKLEAARAPAALTVDGRPDEWSAAPVVAVDTPQQILRGTQSWRGPETDSFRLRLMWDEQKLYLLAEVRDPSHEQTGRGPGVSGGDTLWLYLDPEGRGARIGAKLTLAQTTAGPEVWDWKAGFPLPDAQLAWAESSGGYTYEAALTWESLRARGIAAGKTLSVEVGRGFGGNSFMDLSGRDPDSAANLVPLELLDVAGQGAQPEATPTTSQDPSSVALGVTLDGGESWTVPQAVSPDRDYLWLDLVTPQPIRLESGAHTLRMSYAGGDPARSTIVDGFLLQPAVATKMLTGPEGQRLTLSYDMRQGALSWDE
ncbi:MAG TPA: sugar-binding protein [Herpetosiphonaceae bacterium]